MAMELPDEAIQYFYQGLLVPAETEWTPAAELRARHFLPVNRLRDLGDRLMKARSLVAAERETRTTPTEGPPVESGFIDLPQATLDQFRRKGEASDLGRTLALANRLREDADRVVFLGAGGSHLGGRALFEALRGAYHNELPPESRLGVPRVYFEGQSPDNDSLQDLLDLMQITCIDPERREERWAVVAVSKSGLTLEPGVALRVFRREAAEYYGLRSEWLTRLFAAVTGPSSGLRELFAAYRHADEDVLTIPDNIGGRFAVFTPAGLLPAAVLGLDARALLLGAAAMTKRFLEEPFERNPVLQFAGVNYLMAQEGGASVRALAVWSRKLETLGRWYDQLLSESLGKQGRGPMPLTLVAPRDLHTRGQQLLEGPRDRVVNNLVVRNLRAGTVPIQVQMADHNADDLNAVSRKGVPDVLSASLLAANQMAFDAARPTADLVLPSLSEHVVGQLMQMLMLATVIEARLMGVSPYGQPAADAFKRLQREHLQG